ncbi:MAG: hypothetical protein AB7I41_08090 [Candidatus Sericytochromatia bacterium]
MTDLPKTQRHDLEIEEIEKDRLSSKVRKIRAQGNASENFEALVQKAEDLAKKITYLDEDLRVVETDSAHEVVTLRSDEPQSSPQDVEYFQMELHKDGQTQLERKRYKREETETENVDFVVTEKTLERLGKDLGKDLRGK